MFQMSDLLNWVLPENLLKKCVCNAIKSKTIYLFIYANIENNKFLR